MQHCVWYSSESWQTWQMNFVWVSERTCMQKYVNVASPQQTKVDFALFRSVDGVIFRVLNDPIMHKNIIKIISSRTLLQRVIKYNRYFHSLQKKLQLYKNWKSVVFMMRNYWTPCCFLFESPIFVSFVRSAIDAQVRDYNSSKRAFPENEFVNKRFSTFVVLQNIGL